MIKTIDLLLLGNNNRTVANIFIGMMFSDFSKEYCCESISMLNFDKKQKLLELFSHLMRQITTLDRIRCGSNDKYYVEECDDFYDKDSVEQLCDLAGAVNVFDDLKNFIEKYYPDYKDVIITGEFLLNQKQKDILESDLKRMGVTFKYEFLGF